MDAVKKNEITNVLREKIEKSRSSLDHALLKICALGLPLTIFVKGQLVLDPVVNQSLFSLFALCWTVALVAVIVSFKFSEMGHKKTNANVRRNIKKDGGALKLATWSNRLSLTAFLVGLVFLVVFASANVF